MELTAYEDGIIYTRQRHSGLSTARNKGMHFASGEYLQFIDADDELLPEAYNFCLTQLRTQPVDLLLFQQTRKPTKSSHLEAEPPVSGADYMRRNNLHGSACGYLFRRNILGELRFTPSIFHEDEEFTPLLLLRCETVVAINAPAYLYHQRKGSITSQPTEDKLNDALGIIRKLNKQADSMPTADRTALQRRVAQLTMDYLYNAIRLSSSREALDTQIEQLRQEGLFPLPDQPYTKKYVWFRRLSNSQTGRALLRRLIPLIKEP